MLFRSSKDLVPVFLAPAPASPPFSAPSCAPRAQRAQSQGHVVRVKTAVSRPRQRDFAVKHLACDTFSAIAPNCFILRLQQPVWYRLGESRRGERGKRGGRSEAPPLLLLFSLLFFSWRHGGRGKFSGQSDRDATLLLDDPTTPGCAAYCYLPRARRPRPRFHPRRSSHQHHRTRHPPASETRC